MSIKLMSKVWDDADPSLKGSKLLVMLALADFANDDGTSIYPSIQIIADKARLSTEQARRIIHELTEQGRIRFVEEAGAEQ